MRTTSTTFDEIVMIAGGARGYETGDWSIAPEHPPLVQYLYGFPVYLSGPAYPDESNVPPEVRATAAYRYRYAQRFFWLSGNDPERLAFLGRLPAVLCALAMVLVVFLFTRRIAGDSAALLAAALTAALPDVLAHGGVAYNDVPVALAMLGAVWGIDEALHRPAPTRALLAGCLIALALAVKNSAVALGPIALVLLVLEAVRRRRELDWWRAVSLSTAIVLASGWLTLVLVYRGDFLLAEYRYALEFAFGHVTELPVPSFLLGERSLHGWWYFFPLAFLFKTSAGFHILLGLAAMMLATRLRGNPSGILTSRLRAPLIALLVFGALLVRSDLNIGFRYALPALPLLCILTAAGIARLWPVAGRPLRGVIVAAVLWAAIHVASYYPWFLSYISEYGPGREENHTVLVDSSLDWGQGLLALRDAMREHNIPSVYLSYFGSALPGGYGIDYVPLTSFFPLPPGPPLEQPPVWIAVSATNLSGIYFGGDQFERMRNARPNHVVANTIFLYRMAD
jgi:4-amino-4-deoxy-L-arabinose transferase-like glycosyltransferase